MGTLIAYKHLSQSNNIHTQVFQPQLDLQTHKNKYGFVEILILYNQKVSACVSQITQKKANNTPSE